MTEAEAQGWYLYRFFTRLPCAVPGCRIRHPLYIGKSNDPLRRWLEHAPKQPWWSAQCGYEIDDRVWPDDRSVRAAELDAIHEELPLGNVAGNEGNVHRLVFDDQPQVPRKVARRAAAARAAVVAPRWAPAVKRAAGSHAVRVAAVWLVLAGVLWWAANRAALTAVAGPQYAAAAATGLLLVLWAFVERRTRKTKVRFWRACSLLAVAVLAGFVVWPWVGPHWVEFRHWAQLQQAVSR